MLVLDSAVLGGRVSVVWSSSLVGRTIGENLASHALGYSATATPITNTLATFAFVSGLTGTFTACNVPGLSRPARKPAAPDRKLIATPRMAGARRTEECCSAVMGAARTGSGLFSRVGAADLPPVFKRALSRPDLHDERS